MKLIPMNHVKQGSTKRHVFTSESVTEGHPDKMADQISDAILDAILEKDSRARVACETLVTTGMVVPIPMFTFPIWFGTPWRPSDTPMPHRASIAGPVPFSRPSIGNRPTLQWALIARPNRALVIKE
jgi:hypothetical protein